jgi:hypothetical protein
MVHRSHEKLLNLYILQRPQRLRTQCGVNEPANLQTCKSSSWAFVLNGRRSTFNVQQSPSPMMWDIHCVLSLLCLLPTTALVRAAGSSSYNGPLQAAFRGQPESPTPGPDLEWNFPPNPNSTHHLIFNSVSGLLQRWPNTLRRNGATCYNLSSPISCKPLLRS